MPKVGVFAIIFDRKQRILCVKRGYGKLDWVLPGGRIEENEPPFAALCREVQEETGLSIKKARFKNVYAIASKDDIILSFLVTSIDRRSTTSWTPNAEITDLGFFPKNRLPRPISKQTLRKVHDAYDTVKGFYIELPE